MIKKSVFIWLLIIPLAILNGAFRESVLIPYIGETYALFLSGILLGIMIFIVAYIFIPRLKHSSSANYWKIGLLWLILTLCFEFGFGFLRKIPFSEMIKAYDITTGNLWLFIVLFVGLLPWLVAKLKRII
ncbi:MAG: hypothetical protein LBV72_03165 [Tannerella sp.]|jgi:hypothetical protein|nr:hypothetical protein [Tannerella sp.]